jgi:hypothetical protein
MIVTTFSVFVTQEYMGTADDNNNNPNHVIIYPGKSFLSLQLIGLVQVTVASNNKRVRKTKNKEKDKKKKGDGDEEQEDDKNDSSNKQQRTSKKKRTNNAEMIMSFDEDDVEDFTLVDYYDENEDDDIRSRSSDIEKVLMQVCLHLLTPNVYRKSNIDKTEFELMDKQSATNTIVQSTFVLTNATTIPEFEKFVAEEYNKHLSRHLDPIKTMVFRTLRKGGKQVAKIEQILNITENVKHVSKNEQHLNNGLPYSLQLTCLAAYPEGTRIEDIDVDELGRIMPPVMPQPQTAAAKHDTVRHREILNAMFKLYNDKNSPLWQGFNQLHIPFIKSHFMTGQGKEICDYISQTISPSYPKDLDDYLASNQYIGWNDPKIHDTIRGQIPEKGMYNTLHSFICYC